MQSTNVLKNDWENFAKNVDPRPLMSLNPVKQRKVLLVEDDFTLETIFSSLFEDIDPNLDMDWVTTGEAAVSRLHEAATRPHEAPYDLVIADIFLDGKITGVDFWDLCKVVFPEMPVLLMSGLPLHRFFDLLGTTTTMPPFLQKPLQLNECRQTLQGMLDYTD